MDKTLFLSMVGEPDTNGCMPWLGAKNNKGYGCIGRRSAHRTAYEMATGVKPGKKVVMHKCDNPSCVNPEHLELGTQSQNIKQSYDKGRRKAYPPRLRGEKNPACKLTDKQVEEMRTLFACGISQSALSVAYGISKSQAYRIINKRQRVV